MHCDVSIHPPIHPHPQSRPITFPETMNLMEPEPAMVKKIDIPTNRLVMIHQIYTARVIIAHPCLLNVSQHNFQDSPCDAGSITSYDSSRQGQFECCLALSTPVCPDTTFVGSVGHEVNHDPRGARKIGGRIAVSSSVFSRSELQARFFVEFFLPSTTECAEGRGGDTTIRITTTVTTTEMGAIYHDSQLDRQTERETAAE